MQTEKDHIDQNALSRQLAVYGHETQGKLMAMRVLIHGISGVGLEIAKNLILAGPKQVALCDREKVTIEDLGRNFYAKEQHIGKCTRAEASIKELKELNTNVNVNIVQNDEIAFIVENFDCVVMNDNYNRKYLVELNKACRAKNIGFILCGNLGLYGYGFVDFGEAHRVFDANGEENKTIHIAGITQEEIGLVCLHDQKKHGMSDGDIIIFRDVKGMTEINGVEAEISIKSTNSFTIGDTRKFTPYQTGGMATQVKKPFEMKFHSLEKSLRYPYPPDSKEMPIANWQKFGVPEQLHVILNAVYNYFEKNKRLPGPLNQEDADELYQMVQDFLSKKMEIQGEDFKVEEVDKNLVYNVAKYAETQISPCCSFWGGIITQEIVKMTGKYSPLRQWLHHQFFEVLPEGQVTRSMTHCRQSDYVLLFGDEFVNKAANSNSFLVGAGALGCEFIKMFALMGISTENNNKIFCTDDDNIEISNLNRQFLFRKQHVGSNKSETACKVGRSINSKTNFQSMKHRVSGENEVVFNDDFWTNLDLVVNAVDNVKARQYIDQQCVWYEKPLFQSGTLGTKCHSQIIIPHHTMSYCDIIDPPEESIPLCTLKNFPYNIQHTIQWARDYFEGAYADPSAQLLKFYENPEQLLAQLVKQNKQNPTALLGKLQTLKQMYAANQSKNYQICVELSANIFQDIFHNQIAQLLNAFPQDHIIEETGKLFWSGLKRAPLPIKLDLKDPLQLEFIQAGANIFAFMFNIEMLGDEKLVQTMAKQVKLTEFIAKKINIEVDEKEKKQAPPVQLNEDQEKEVQELLKELRSITPNKARKPSAVEFEKDDPTNYHIEFIGGISNLRARNYKIDEIDNFKVKLIAGKIIPAIATTTAMVVGVVGIEIIKFLLNKKPDLYKNVMINLALPMWVFSDPLPPIINQDSEFDPIMCGPIKAIPGSNFFPIEEFTKWDKIDIKGPMTIGDMKTHFETTYDIEVAMITFGTSTVFSSFGSDSKDRLQMRVQVAIQHVTKKEFPKWKKIICIGVSGNVKDGTDCLLPDVRYRI